MGVQALVTLGFRVGSWQLRREVGLSTQGWGGFLRDTAVSWVLEALALALLVLVVVGLARRFARTWTWVAGTALAATVVLVSYVYPVAIEPLFHDFTALPEGELREEITRVAADEGVGIADVVVADASRRTTTLNAWVSGFGETRRVVLYDTLVAEASQDEVLAVVAHELAHARHDDVLVGTALGATGAMAAVAALGLAVGWLRTAGDPRVVPLLLACLAWGAQAVAPVENSISRAVEMRADVEALCQTQDPQAFKLVQQRLAERSLTDPTPPAWSHWWWGSHPTALERWGLAEDWASVARREC